MRRFLINAAGVGAGAFSIYYLVFTVTRFGPAYFVWAAFTLFLFFVPISAIVGGLVGTISWLTWLLLRGAPGLLGNLVPATVAAGISAGMVLLVWTLFNLEGPVVVAGILAGAAFGVTVYIAARLSTRDWKIGDSIESA